MMMDNQNDDPLEEGPKSREDVLEEAGVLGVGGEKNDTAKVFY